MNDKKQFITQLKEEFNRWEALLSSLSEAQITARRLPSDLSIKDVIAHLYAWQQISVARMEAAQLDQEPEFPQWAREGVPEEDEDPDRVNALIHEAYLDQPWPEVHRNWREGFLRFLELGEAVPEKDLLEPGRYPWMHGEPLSLVLQASYEHHHIEHLEPLLAWLQQDRNKKANP